MIMYRNLIFLILVITLLGGCAIGPKFQLPNHSFALRFKYQHQLSSDTQGLISWWSQFSDPLLDRLIEEALLQNYDLAQALEVIEQSRASYRLSRAQLWPEIDGILQVNQNKYSTVLAQTSFLDADPIDPYLQLGFQGSWEIDLWGKLINDLHAAHFSIKAQVQAYCSVRLMVVTTLVRWYIDWCTAVYKLTITEQQLRVVHRQLLLTQSLYKAGLSNESVVEAKKKQCLSLESQAADLHSVKIEAHAQIAVLLGKAPDQFDDQCAVTVPLFKGPIATGIPSELIRRRPDIRQKEYELATQNQKVARAIKEWFPSFSLLGGLSAESSEGSFWFTAGAITWSIGPSFNWPILNFGRINARIDERKAEMRKAALAYSQAIITALADVEQALGVYFQLCNMQNFITQKYDASVKRTRLARDLFESGLSDELAYLDLCAEQLIVQHECADIQQIVSKGIVGIYSSLGGGW